MCPLISKVQRSRVDATAIKLPACTISSPQASNSSDVESTISESSLDASDLQFQDKLDKTNKSFTEYKIGKSTLEHLKVEILQNMCYSRSLDDRGTREAMAAQLIEWVRSIPQKSVDLLM